MCRILADFLYNEGFEAVNRFFSLIDSTANPLNINIMKFDSQPENLRLLTCPLSHSAHSARSDQKSQEKSRKGNF